MAVKYGTKEWDKAYDKILKERLESNDEPYILGTPEWVYKYREIINQDDEYKEVGKAWDTVMAMGIGAKPEYGVYDDLHLKVCLSAGVCTEAKLIPKEAADEAPYFMAGSYELWQSIVRGEMEALKATIQGDMTLRGDLAKVMKYVGAAKRLGELAGSFEAKWPEDLSPEELETYKADFNSLREQLGF
jgi:putative sterol carrier protein